MKNNYEVIFRGYKTNYYLISEYYGIATNKKGRHCYTANEKCKSFEEIITPKRRVKREDVFKNGNPQKIVGIWLILVRSEDVLP